MPIGGREARCKIVGRNADEWSDVLAVGPKPRVLDERKLNAQRYELAAAYPAWPTFPKADAADERAMKCPSPIISEPWCKNQAPTALGAITSSIALDVVFDSNESRVTPAAWRTDVGRKPMEVRIREVTSMRLPTLHATSRTNSADLKHCKRRWCSRYDPFTRALLDARKT
eukprot:scaffold291310_cov31-Tisochrysis_lutea.AAC.2